MNKPNTNFFLAISLPGSVRSFLKQRASQLQSTFSFKSWVSSVDYHITLIFLGKSVGKRLNDLEMKLSPVIAQHPAFRMTLGNVGTFGKKHRPSVLWNGVTADETLYRLHRDVDGACTDIGFDLDERPFHPHITLARKWSSPEKLDPSELENALEADNNCYSWTVHEIALYQSFPNKTPRYHVVRRFPLEGGQ